MQNCKQIKKTSYKNFSTEGVKKGQRTSAVPECVNAILSPCSKLDPLLHIFYLSMLQGVLIFILKWLHQNKLAYAINYAKPDKEWSIFAHRYFKDLGHLPYQKLPIDKGYFRRVFDMDLDS